LRRLLPLLLFVGLLQGCVYKLGGGLTAGMVDEATGKGRTDGVKEITDRVIADQAARQLGQQLGEGLTSGVQEMTPELKVQIETSVDDILAVAFARAGKGMREDLSPELREMVRQDIVQALADGMKGPVSDSMQQTADQVVKKTIASLSEALQDPVLRDSLASLIRESTYQALREGHPGSPGVGETLQTTLSENVLAPFETSIGGLTQTVADRVDESARRTEHTLQGVISALVVILGVTVLLYALTRRQLNRERTQSQTAHLELRQFGAALGQLDEAARARLLGKLDEYQRAHGARESYVRKATAPGAPPRERSTNYYRDEDE